MSLFVTDSIQDYDQSLILAWLTQALNLNSARLDQILNTYSSLNEAASDDFQQLRQHNLKWLDKWTGITSAKQLLESFAKNLESNQIQFITIWDTVYPSGLKNLSNYPLVLFYQGNLDLLSRQDKLTVVGSRSTVAYTETILKKILEPVCGLGIGIVSGLAVGVDALAHRIALSQNTFTIAVVGSGIDNPSFYPSQNLALRDQMLARGGLVLSEYPPGMRANTYTFPQRNRILAALSELTWVVQASQKSGSLITALKAQELGKNIATTPGSILDENLAGNLQLLQDGASLIATSQDILGLLGLKSHPSIKPQPTIQFGSNDEQKIYKLLSLEPKNTQLISIESGFDLPSLNSHLTMLELSNLAINLGENNWIRGG